MNIPIYVINLDRSPKRLADISNRLALIGLKFIRVPGVDGRELSESFISSVCKTAKGWIPISRGELGCCLGHRRAWEAISKSEYEFGCVLEDDAILSRRLPELLCRVGEFPIDLEILKLDTSHLRVWFSRKATHVGPFEAVRLYGSHYGAGAYIVSRSAARKLLALTERFSYPIDVVLFDQVIGLAKRFNVFQIVPALCNHSCYDNSAVIHASDIGIERSRFCDGELKYKVRKYAEEVRKVVHRARLHRRKPIDFDPAT